MDFLRREKQPEALAPELSYAEATARVQPMRERLTSIAADLEDANRAREEHECNTVLAGGSIDPSFNQRVESLQGQKHALEHTLQRLEARIETIRQTEEARAREARLQAAEQRRRDLQQQHRDAVGKAIAAVYSAHVAFTETVMLGQKIAAHQSRELPHLTSGIPQLIPPSSFTEKNSVAIWERYVCRIGYADFVPDDHLGKQMFIKNDQ